MKKIEVNIYDVLDAIRLSVDFSFDRAMFYYHMALILRKLSIEDIDGYVKQLPSCFDKEDRENIKDFLVNFKEGYIDGGYKEDE